MATVVPLTRSMPTGMRLRLNQPTVALELVDGKRTIVALPTEAIVVVLGGFARDEKMIDVCWEEREVAMFNFDLVTRGTVMKNYAAAA